MNTLLRSIPTVLLLGCASDKAGQSSTPTTPTGHGADGADGAAGPDDSGSGETGAPPDPRLALQIAPPRHVESGVFATPDLCADCHSNAAGATAMRTADGTGVSPYDLQHGSMMANAARDPLFWAVLSAELDAAPSLTAEVEATCLRCHAPMAVHQAALDGTTLPSAAELRQGTDSTTALGREGVSCTTCHRISPDGMGQPETWSGLFEIEPSKAIFGPHADPFTTPMENHTGFTPTEGSHMLESEVCASCHTLQTPTVSGDTPTGHTFLEQASYLEWQISAFGPDGDTPRACQSCHMSTADAGGTAIETRIARNPGGSDFPIDPRQPFGQHFQVGGNTFMLGILRDNADVLNPRADRATFDAAIARTQTMLGTAGGLSLSPPVRSGTSLSLAVTVTNDTGHKLPTAYPSRRAWLQLTVTDSTGATVFASGQTDVAGRIVDTTGAPLGSELAGGPVQPHRTQITDPTEVLIYQSLMADPEGAPVFRLLNAAQMAKDNRILPRGWQPDRTLTPVGDLAPVGVDGDPDFVAGSDTVAVQLTDLGGSPPYIVDAALVYQPVSPRYIAELALVDTPEVAAFLAMAETARWTPEVVASAQVTAD